MFIQVYGSFTEMFGTRFSNSFVHQLSYLSVESTNVIVRVLSIFIKYRVARAEPANKQSCELLTSPVLWLAGAPCTTVFKEMMMYIQKSLCWTGVEAVISTRIIQKQ